MAILLDTTSLPPPARADAVRDTVANAVARSDISFGAHRHAVRYRLECWPVGPTVLVRAGGDPVRMRRTAVQVRDSAPEQATFGFLLSGRGYHVQDGTRTAETAGDVTLLDMTRPFEFGMGTGSVHGSLGIGLDVLGLPVDAIRRSAPHLAGSPIFDLFRSHLNNLTPLLTTLPDGPELFRVGSATVELARALIATTHDFDTRSNAPWQDALGARIVAYARQHLREPGLSVARLAAVHHISVRQLYKVWSYDNDVGIAAWIMEQRLEGARRDLVHPDGRALTVSAVARRWGFVDASHFSRRFRLAYGMAPHEWRLLNRETSAADGAHRPR